MVMNTKLGAALVASFLVSIGTITAADKAAKIAADAQAALGTLYEKTPSAKTLGQRATAILVFPEVTKAGFVVGGQHGDGALFKGGTAVAYYKTTGASVGLQAGAQTYAYALFFMSEKALQQLDKAGGFEIGSGPNVVMMDEGKAASLTTTTAKDDIYAFVFGQKGLMAGIDIGGNKISKSNPK